MVSDCGTSPLVDYRIRSPDTLKRSSIMQMASTGSVKGQTQHFQITPAVRITSYGDSHKSKEYSSDLAYEGVISSNQAVIEVHCL